MDTFLGHSNFLQHQKIDQNMHNINEGTISSSSSSSSSSSVISSADNENNHTSNSSRPSTPPTPCSSISESPKTSNIFKSNSPLYNYDDLLQSLPNCQDYLQLIEPNPVLPPSYDTLPPGGCPKFPINFPISSYDQQYYDSYIASSSITTDKSFQILNQEILPPSYSPAIYKIGIVARKLEWNNPFELSSNRSWKYFIAELNSTQLNLYNLPTQYETQIFAFNPKNKINNGYKIESTNNSIFTDYSDHQFYDYVKKLGLLDDSSYNNKKKGLVRSYSLQHTKLGLATDYKKKVNVLRLRIENEQILLNFGSIQDLIDWNLALNVGKDVSLDINERELPKYRTVPRRRRRNRNRNNSNGNSNRLRDFNSSSNNNLNNSNNRSRSLSDPNKIKGSLSKLKLKLIKSRSKNSKIQSFGKGINQKQNNVGFDTPLAVNRSRSENDLYNPIENSSSSYHNFQQSQRNGNHNQPQFFINSDHHRQHEDEDDYNVDDDDDDDDEYDDEFNEVLRRSRIETSIHDHLQIQNQNTPNIVDDQEDIQNMSDLPHSDDEDDEDEEDVDEVIDENEEEEEDEEYEDTDEYFTPPPSESQSQSQQQQNQKQKRQRSSNPKNFNNDLDYKWNPPLDKPQTKKKYYKICLRCIKPLTMEDSWCSKILVKPTSLSPLEITFLRIIKYSGPNGELLSSASSSSSLYSLGKKNNGSLFKDSNNIYGNSNKNIILPDVALTRLPNHFLKEFLVGSHGLIPREII
ncbi:uncharacterized protein KGF55_002291 [Candida pseudojiufengensis]|uniref:uncharacterized protein n=1 Tax=Candida pseudojiufengensis TaxID=497109 RepID=UPI0022240711|nr:uncharacterized protein KGF55_002291 [Candida pseudojiufengensis]KAI5964349.1 hypothetical protein KGF55_002291 [Candida pseudojiufengensis]